MSLGERARLYAVPELCYGPRGIPGVIPPNAHLIFDIEIINIGGKFRLLQQLKQQQQQKQQEQQQKQAQQQEQQPDQQLK